MKKCLVFTAFMVVVASLHGCNVFTSRTTGFESDLARIEKGQPIHLDLAWKYALSAPVVATPVASGNQLLVAAENGNLYSFDLLSQKLLWIYRAEGAIATTPAIANGVIYFLSRDGFLQALDQLTGKRLWRFATGGEARFAVVGSYGMVPEAGAIPDPWDFQWSSPVVEKGKVYFGSSDKKLYALDAVSGTEVWSFTADNMIHSAPAIHNGKLFFGTWGSKVYALDADTGAELWQFQAGVDAGFVMQGISASPALDEQYVYLGARDGYVYALRQTDGTTVWRYDAQSSWVLAEAALDTEHVYVTTSDTGLLLALDKRSGSEQYRADTRFWTYTKPLLVDERYVFVGNMLGELYGFDKKTGAALWYYQTSEGRADINDIINDESGKLRAEKVFSPNVQLQASVEWVKSLGAFVASPIWVNNQLIAVTATGDVLLFKNNK
ncbi:PQQ-binding-like beta-propeller repeat protein [Cellvibrio sp. UBA7661]|uniref:PQQ-binding-like beta-propeller repeat protein n=1 Tax=Cellvibrio sp. UBA7661 TaxID=1946311 RepID=UPI002F356E8A